jgi:hypothetical protein
MVVTGAKCEEDSRLAARKIARMVQVWWGLRAQQQQQRRRLCC